MSNKQVEISEIKKIKKGVKIELKYYLVMYIRHIFLKIKNES